MLQPCGPEHVDAGANLHQDDQCCRRGYCMSFGCFLLTIHKLLAFYLRAPNRSSPAIDILIVSAADQLLYNTRGFLFSIWKPSKGVSARVCVPQESRARYWSLLEKRLWGFGYQPVLQY